MLPSNLVEVREYLDANGRSPFGIWFESLDARTAAKISSAIVQMEHGNLSDSKSVGTGVVERRVHHGPGYRVYYGRDGDELIILLAGGDKGSQRHDIAAAQELWREYKLRKRRGE